MTHGQLQKSVGCGVELLEYAADVLNEQSVKPYKEIGAWQTRMFPSSVEEKGSGDF